VATQPDPVF